MMKHLAIKGGIGDFLQCLPFMLAHRQHRYLVASHHDRVTEFFATFGIEVEELSLGRLTGIENCPRSTFFRGNPFPRLAPVFRDRPVVGVHLGGSRYSLGVEKRFGFPSKALPRSVLDAIMSAPDYNFLLFGSAAELAELGVRNSTRLRLVCAEDITANLARVADCSALVGSDSAFKTMSAMLRIQTIVWIGDYRDDTRDGTFVGPYVEAGVMSTFRYRDLSNHGEVVRGTAFSLEKLRQCVPAYA